MGETPADGWSGSDPELGKPRFSCPHCGAFSAMVWGQVRVWQQEMGRTVELSGWKAAECQSCDASSLWRYDGMMYPSEPMGPLPNGDMPSEVRALFDEARAVAALSGRSAAGLLRLALQVLVDGLVTGSDDLNKKIGALVGRGLSATIQQAMDTVRVAGNNAVHPGAIQLHEQRDDLETLFQLVNLVVDQMIRQPRLVAEMYAKIPEGAKVAVETRDNGSR